MKKIYLVIFASCITIIAIAQESIKNNKIIMLWSPRIASTEFYNYFPTKFEISNSNGIIETKKVDKGSNMLQDKAPDYLIGAQFLLVKPRSHFGAFGYLDYKNKGFQMKTSSDVDFVTHNIRSISPALGLRLRTGDFTKSKHFVVEAGAAYNYNIQYFGGYNNDIKAVNNGFTSIIGFAYDYEPGERNKVTESGWQETATKNFFMSINIQYHHDMYNIFNENYTPDNINYPLKGFSSKSSYIAITFTFRGGYNGQKKN